MKTKTSELEGAALDWAVAMAICPESFKSDRVEADGLYPWCRGWLSNGSPSKDWSQGGPLIESHHLIIESDMGLEWAASAPTELQYDEPGWVTLTGPNVLIAACRAIVAAKIGAEVDVPEGLACI